MKLHWRAGRLPALPRRGFCTQPPHFSSLELPAAVQRSFEQSRFNCWAPRRLLPINLRKALYTFYHVVLPPRNAERGFYGLFWRAFLCMWASKLALVFLPLNTKLVFQCLYAEEYWHSFGFTLLFAGTANLATFLESKRRDRTEEMMQKCLHSISVRAYARLLGAVPEGELAHGLEAAKTFDRLARATRENIDIAFNSIFTSATQVIFSLALACQQCGVGASSLLLVCVLLFDQLSERCERRIGLRPPELESAPGGLPLQDALRHRDAVRVLGAQGFFLSRYSRELRGAAAVAEAKGVSDNKIYLQQRLIMTGCFLLTAFGCFGLIGAGALAKTDVILLLGLALQTFNSLMCYRTLRRRWIANYPRLAELLRLLGAPAAARADPAAPGRAAGDLCFSDLRLGAAEGERPAEIRVRAGSLCALMGGSCAPKTLIFDLLLGRGEPGRGRAAIGGRDVRGLADGHLRDISYLPEAHLFVNDTLLNNILVGDFAAYFLPDGNSEFVARLDAPDERVLALVDHFDFGRVVSALPDQYGFGVGEDGARLSAAQRQTVQIIRALLKPAEIYLFAEPENFLDAASRLAFLRRAEGLRDRGKTVVLATNELDYAVKADQILFFNKDGSFEEGAHAQLIGLQGSYRRYFQAKSALSSPANA